MSVYARPIPLLSALALACVVRSGNAATTGSATAPAPADAELAPLVVTTDRLAVETLIDRKVYSVRSDLQSSFGSVSDILSAIPSVDVDAEGGVSLRGDSNVQILVDGRPSALFSGPSAGDNLQSFPASQIERIEILTTPPAEYRAEGVAGIINIVTRRQRSRGISGSLQASRGNADRSTVGADASYGGGPLSASVTAAYRRDTRQRSVRSDLVAPDGPGGSSVDHRSRLDEDISRASPPVGISVQYAPDARRTVDVAVSRTSRNASRDYTEFNDAIAANGALAGAARRLSAGQDREADDDARVGLTQKFARPGETLDLGLHRSAAHEAEHYDYANDGLFPPAPAYRDSLGFREDHRDAEFSVDYVLPVAKARTLKLGLALEQDDYGYEAGGGRVDPVSGAELPDPSLSDQFRFRQRTGALYSSYQVAAGAWNWLYGLRTELTRADLRPPGAARSDRYLRAYPNLHVERRLSEQWTLSFGASRRVTRPDPADLDPYVDHEYTPNLRSGNPGLRPQYTQAFDAGVSHEGHRSEVAVTGYYRRNRDSTTSLVVDLGQGITLTTRANLPRNDAAGVEFGASGHFAPQLSYAASGNLFYSEIDATSLGTPGLRSTTGLNAKLKLEYRPTGSDALQLNVTRTDRRLNPQGYVSAIDIVNVGYRHQLTPDLTMVGTASDLFNGQHYERTAATASFTEDYVRRIRGRVVYVGVVYAFGSQARHKPANFEFDPGAAP